MTTTPFKTILLSSLIIGSVIIPTGFSEVMAQKKDAKATEKQASQTEVNEGLDEVNKTIVALTQKIYAASLFSPKDNDKLIGLKLKLNELWIKNPTNRELAKPMYDTAIILKNRELYDEAIDLLTIVIENFPPDEEAPEGTVSIDYSSKAQSLLDKIKKESAPQ